MLVKNISGVSQRIISGSGEIRILPNDIVNIPTAHFNRRTFVEVDEHGNPKSATPAYVTENDKRTMAMDTEPVVTPSGQSVEKVLDVAPVVEPVAPVAEVKAEEPTPKKAAMNTTKSVLGRPKKLA